MLQSRFCRFIFALVLISVLSGAACAAANPLLGLWMTEDKDGVVQFYPCEDRYCGRFYWLKVDSAANPSLDFRNSDDSLKKRPLCGMTFLGGFKDQGNGEYEEGWIYSPRHGSMFSSNLRLTDKDHLALRGYVFLPFLGGTQIWTRVEQAQACDLLVKK